MKFNKSIKFFLSAAAALVIALKRITIVTLMIFVLALTLAITVPAQELLAQSVDTVSAHNTNASYKLFGDFLYTGFQLTPPFQVRRVKRRNCKPGQYQIAFFRDANYRGECVKLDIGQYKDSRSIRIEDNSVSSVRIGGKVSAILCIDRDFQRCGAYKWDIINMANQPPRLLDSATPSELFRKVGDNAVSSVIVCKGNSLSCWPVSRGSYDKLYFKNECNRPIYTAIHYKNLNDQWVTKGWWLLESGEKTYVAKTRNRHYYIYAKSKDNRTYWGGNDYYDKIRGSSKNYGFKHKRITTDTWGELTYRFSCR